MKCPFCGQRVNYFTSFLSKSTTCTKCNKTYRLKFSLKKFIPYSIVFYITYISLRYFFEINMIEDYKFGIILLLAAALSFTPDAEK